MAVQFDEGPVLPSRPPSAKRLSLITGLLIKTGLVKSERGAKLLLLLVALIAIAVTAYLLTAGRVIVEPPTAAEIIVN